MEILIIICMLIIIALLLQDKIVIKKRSEQKTTKEKVNPNLPDIMGQPKPLRSLLVSNKATENQKQKEEINPSNLDIEYEYNENVGIQIPQEELDDVFNEMPDFEEEEEEWHRYREPNGESGLATGVTFDELSTVGVLLQKKELEPFQQQEAVGIVQKLQGTELFSLLENSIDGASQKIAELLDSTLSTEIDPGSSIMRNDDFEDFNLGEFV